PPALGLLDHGEADAILHAAARVGALELRPDLPAVAGPGHPPERDHRSESDEVEQRARDVTGKRHERVAAARGKGDTCAVRGESIERVAVVFPGALGDLLLALPALRLVRARHAGAHLTLVVSGSLLSLASLADVADAVASLDDRDG